MNETKQVRELIRAFSKKVVMGLTRQNGLLGVSESVTGGEVAASLTRVDGCSKILFASQVLYSKLGKLAFCQALEPGMTSKMLDEEGTVSRAVIESMNKCMVARMKRAFETHAPDKSDWPMVLLAAATCGIAGASVEGKEGGLVHYGVRIETRATGDNDNSITWKTASDEIKDVVLQGSREGIILETAALVLGMAVSGIKNLPGNILSKGI